MHLQRKTVLTKSNMTYKAKESAYGAKAAETGWPIAKRRKAIIEYKLLQVVVTHLVMPIRKGILLLKITKG